MPRPRGFALTQVSHANRLKILGLMQEKGPTSRTELAQLTGLSLPAVSRIVGLLVQKGYAREVGLGDSNGGRKPVLVEAIADAGFVIGVDLGGTCVLAAGADLKGQVLHTTEIYPEGGEVLEGVYAAIHEAINRLSATEQKRVLGIGVGTPGVLDYDSGTVISASNLGWRNVRLREQLQGQFHLPVFVDNDANLAALAEWSQGAGRGVQHLVHITVSRGLGAGIIINGQIHRGAGGTAGEIGETYMAESTESERGWRTLEGLCSGRALVGQAKEALEHGEITSLLQACGGQAEGLTFEMILAAAAAGDPLAVRLVGRAAGYLGVGIANVVNTLDPQLVVIGGILAQAGNLVLGPICETLDRLLSPVMRGKVRVGLGMLGERAGVIGAASLVLHNALAPPLRHGDAVSLLLLERVPRAAAG